MNICQFEIFLTTTGNQSFVVELTIEGTTLPCHADIIIAQTENAKLELAEMGIISLDKPIDGLESHPIFHEEMMLCPSVHILSKTVKR